MLIETNQGMVDYEPVESRLARFRKDEAYANTRIITSFQSRAAALGLPESALSQFDQEYLGKPIFVFRAELQDQSGRVIACRHALGELQNHKDFETLETTSVGRLLTALGYGSSTREEAEAEQNSVIFAFGASPATSNQQTQSGDATANLQKPEPVVIGPVKSRRTDENALSDSSDVPEATPSKGEHDDPIPPRLLPTIKAKHSQLVAEAQRHNLPAPAMPTCMKEATQLMSDFAQKHRRVGAKPS